MTRSFCPLRPGFSFSTNWLFLVSEICLTYGSHTHFENPITYVSHILFNAITRNKKCLYCHNLLLSSIRASLDKADFLRIRYILSLLFFCFCFVCFICFGFLFFCLYSFLLRFVLRGWLWLGIFS